MARCRECRSYNVKVTATSSRKSFVYQCVNPRCRISYVQTLSIGRDLSAALSSVQTKRYAARSLAEREKGDVESGEPD